MAFPPKKPGIGIMIGVKPKSQPPDDLGAPDSLDDDPTTAPKTPTGGGDGTVGPLDVGYSAEDTCATCANNQNSQCMKYSFAVTDTGHCEGGYEPGDRSKPDANNQRMGLSDQDADDGMPLSGGPMSPAGMGGR